jgi:hypothetical protein
VYQKCERKDYIDNSCTGSHSAGFILLEKTVDNIQRMFAVSAVLSR